MRLFLPLPLLLVLVPVSLAAQTEPLNKPGAAADSLNTNSSPTPDFLSSTLKAGSNVSGADRIHVEEFRPRYDHFVLPPVLRFNSDGLSTNNTVCFTMRTYKVARDDAQSDSVHPVGYTTCQPSTRFQMHTIELRTTDPKR